MSKVLYNTFFFVSFYIFLLGNGLPSSSPTRAKYGRDHYLLTFVFPPIPWKMPTTLSFSLPFKLSSIKKKKNHAVTQDWYSN